MVGVINVVIVILGMLRRGTDGVDALLGRRRGVFRDAAI